MARHRDTQRARCYTAEREVFTFHPTARVAGLNATMGELKYGKALSTDEMVELHHLIGHSKRLVGKYRGGQTKKVRVVIDGHRTRGGAASYGSVIKYSPKAKLDWIVCHEMAHELNVSGGASHGWQFCAIYIDIVRWVIGKEAAEALKASFKRNKVRFTKPRPKRAPKLPTEKQLAARAVFAARRKQQAFELRLKKERDYQEAVASFKKQDALRWAS